MCNHLGENAWLVAMNYITQGGLKVRGLPRDIAPRRAACGRVAGALREALLLVMAVRPTGKCNCTRAGSGAHKAHSLESSLFYQYIVACLDVYYST